MLSSDRPLVSPRFKRRSSITSSEHSKNNTKSHSVTYMLYRYNGLNTLKRQQKSEEEREKERELGSIN